jgi:hypothetical protein
MLVTSKGNLDVIVSLICSQNLWHYIKIGYFFLLQDEDFCTQQKMINY